jgi:transcriptional regulator with PAS, ATPase and Fis domain
MSDDPIANPPSDDEARGLAQLLESHDDPTVLIDDAYTIIATNRAYADAYGATADDLRGNKCHRVSHRSDVPCHERGEDCPVKRVMAEGRRVETLHIHFHEDEGPERVQVRGYPVDLGGRRLLLERIRRLDPDEPIGREMGEELLGNSPVMLGTLQRLLQAARLTGSVLIQGESGVGKELAARFVHRHSARAAGPFVTADCTAIPETLFESELFGHERGAFTGSAQRRIGLFESANEGTLFLDEIGELPMSMQAKLLRAIETGEIRRLGSSQTIQTQVRIVAATNRDLRRMVADGTFRLDLYYRLATHEVLMPPLRDRTQDIPLICRHLLSRFGMRPPPAIDEAALRRLAAYRWPGKVRELRNVLERALADGPLIHAGIVERVLTGEDRSEAPPVSGASPPALRPLSGGNRTGFARTASADRPAGRPDEDESLDSLQRRLLVEHLHRFDGNRARVAAALGVSERTVYRWIRRYQV